MSESVQAAAPEVETDEVSQAEVEANAAAEAARRRRRRTARLVELGVGLALVVLIAVSVVTVDGFTDSYNLRSVLTASTFVGLVAIGMTFVVISGNYIDLSVVAQVATAAIVVVVVAPVDLALAVLAALAATFVFAMANGLGVGVMRGNGVVVTLAVQTAGLGLLDYLTQGAQYTNTSSPLRTVATASVGPFPWVFIFLVAVAAGGQFVLTRTNLGFAVRAVGTRREAARTGGVRPAAAVFTAFGICSLCCALAGILLAGFNNNALPSIGSGYDFNALAAIIIGGTSLFGGRGSVLRTILGVLFIAILLNVLVLVGLPFEWQQLVKGAIIVAAVAGDALLSRRGIR